MSTTRISLIGHDLPLCLRNYIATSSAASRIAAEPRFSYLIVLLLRE